jgi:hypothetical protein
MDVEHGLFLSFLLRVIAGSEDSDLLSSSRNGLHPESGQDPPVGTLIPRFVSQPGGRGDNGPRTTALKPWRRTWLPVPFFGARARADGSFRRVSMKELAV